MVSERVPVGLPLWLVFFPPVGYFVGMAACIAAASSLAHLSWYEYIFIVGMLLAALAVVSAFVIVPVCAYSLLVNPSLRTPSQLSGAFLGLLIIVLMLLSLFSGWIRALI